MKFIGNYKEWINQSWIDEVLLNRGTARPLEGKRPDSLEEEKEYAKAREAGYSDDAIYFYMFDKKTVSFEITPPPFVQGKFHWWITKMLPGNFMPMHVDPHTKYEKNSKRYWIALQDYQSGHIFMYKNRVITDYKLGDVWCYEDSTAEHGAANIGRVPRIILQISSYDQ
jgi:hypothetical protein